MPSPSARLLAALCITLCYSTCSAAQAPPRSCGACASNNAIWCTDLAYPRYIGSNGTCLQPGNNYSGCAGFAYYVPPTFKTCEYVFSVSQPPLALQIEEWYIAPFPQCIFVTSSQVLPPALLRSVL